MGHNVIKSSFGLLGNIQHYVTKILEGYYFWHGKNIAKYPKSVILICFLFTGISALGLLNFKLEADASKLWIKYDSHFLDVFNWRQENFPSDIRPQLVLYESHNILDKNVLLTMAELYKNITYIRSTNKNYAHICKKIATFGDVFSKDSTEKGQMDWMSHYFRTDYCNMIESYDTDCYTEGILELWKNDPEIIKSRSQEEIYRDINTIKRSPIFGRPINITQYLSGITFNDSYIIGAKSSIQIFVTIMDKEAIDNGDIFIDDFGLDHAVDRETFEWEGKFIELLENINIETDDLEVFFMTKSSLNRIAKKTIFSDLDNLALGFIVEYIFVIVMLGKFNAVQQRPILGLFGLLAVGFSIITSYGLCSGFGATYSPVCSIIPFLLLGLGIDDMFIITDSWNNLSPFEKKDPLVDRIGHALKHSGVSITIASMTNFLAFAVNVSSFIPATSNFYLFASAGILWVFIYQTTFFTAWLTLDQKRLEDQRHGLIWCIKMKNWEPNSCSQKNYLLSAFKKIARMLTIKWVKGVIFIITFTFLGVNLWRVSKLEKDFNIIWLVPEDEHMHQFYVRQQEYFPELGAPAEVIFGEIDYFEEFTKLLELTKKLEDSKYIGRINSWAKDFKIYIEDRGYNMSDPDVDRYQFQVELGEFLYSERGMPYKEIFFRFNGTLDCLDPAPNIIRSKFTFNQRVLASKDGIKAMAEARNLVYGMNFSNYAEPFSYIYASYENDRVIIQSLLTTFSLALAIIFITTLCLLASLQAGMLVLLCVAFSLLDLVGTMQFWGLYIEFTSSTTLVLALGLCVDYAAHIAHTFMNQTGTLDERMQKTLAKMGPAVFNGGVSTFIAFIFLAGSKSYILITFFKCFLFVTFYGLFHGLIFLPVLLSLVGPAPYARVIQEENEQIKEMKNLQALNGEAHNSNKEES